MATYFSNIRLYYIQVHLNKLECRETVYLFIVFISVIQIKLWNSCIKYIQCTQIEVV